MIFYYATLSQDPFYKNYDTEDGLPSSEVYKIIIDDFGQIHASTDRGLAIYNSYNFDILTEKSGLADNTILGMIKDNVGGLWLQGLDHSLTYILNNKITKYRYNKELEEIGKKYKFEQLLISNKDNNLLISLKSHSRENSKIIKIKHTHSKIEYIQEEDFEGAKTVYSDSHKRVIELDNSNIIITKKRMKFLEGCNWDTRDLFYFNNNTLYRINKGTNQIDSMSLEANIISINTEINKSSVWVCTYAGLFQINSKNIQNIESHFFQNLDITSIDKDNEENLWISSLDNGIFLIPDYNMKSVRTSNVMLNPEKTLTATALNNHIVLSTSEDRIYTIDKKNKFKWLKKRKTHDHQLSSATKLGNEINISYGYIVKESGNDIDIYDNEVTYKLSYKIKPSCTIFASRNKLIHYDGTRKRDIKSNVLKGNILCLQMYNDTLFVGTTKGLFYLVDKHINNVKEYQPDNKNLKIRVNKIKIDSEKRIWLATSDGIRLIQNNRIIKMTEKDGLISDFVNDIIIQNKNTIWVATNKGLNRIIYGITNNNIDSYYAEKILTESGLLSNYINQLEIWNNKLWIATNKGLNYFDLVKKNYEHKNVPIILESIKLQGAKLDEKKSYKFAYHENDLTFNYYGISHLRNLNNRNYKYRLKSKYNNSSFKFTNNTEVSFQDLPSGEYTFEAYALNGIRTQSKDPIIVKFEITKHFIYTWWFKLGVIIIASIIIYSLIKMNQNRIIEKERTLQMFKSSELKERTYKLEALRSQMNPHFIFNSMNSIQKYILKKEIRQANNYLTCFADLMRESLQYSRVKYINLKEELGFIKKYLNLELLRTPNRFTYQIEISDSIIQEQTQVPALLIQPVLENSIRHGFKGIDYKGQINITFGRDKENNLIICVRDNGIGLKNTKNTNRIKLPNESFGLILLRERVELLNIENKDKSFAKLTITDLDNQSNQTGVEVKFNIPQIKKYD